MPRGMLVANDYLLILILNNLFIYSYIKFVQRLMTILYICRMRLTALNLLHKLNNLQLILEITPTHNAENASTQNVSTPNHVGDFYILLISYC